MKIKHYLRLLYVRFLPILGMWWQEGIKTGKNLDLPMGFPDFACHVFTQVASDRVIPVLYVGGFFQHFTPAGSVPCTLPAGALAAHSDQLSCV